MAALASKVGKSAAKMIPERTGPKKLLIASSFKDPTDLLDTGLKSCDPGKAEFVIGEK